MRRTEPCLILSVALRKAGEEAEKEAKYATKADKQLLTCKASHPALCSLAGEVCSK